MNENKHDKNSDFAKSEIEELINKKILEAKLERYEEQSIVSKNQLDFFFKIGFALLAIFGLILPLSFQIYNLTRVDNAIERMENEVEEALATINRRPELEVEFNERKFNAGAELVFYHQLDSNNNIINIQPEKHTLNLQNVGDAQTDLRIHLYLPSDTIINKKYKSRGTGWEKWPYSHEENFSYAMVYEIFDAMVPTIDATERIRINIEGKMFRYNTKIDEIPAVLTIFYGQPKPLRIPFKIIFKVQETSN